MFAMLALSFAIGQPAPKVPPPRASLAFFDGNQKYTLNLKIVTAKGNTHTYVAEFDSTTPEDAREHVFKTLDGAGWAVKRLGDTAIQIDGADAAGTIDRIGKVVLIISGRKSKGKPPALTGTLDVKIESKEKD